jgi:chromosomal replication initiator protein
VNSLLLHDASEPWDRLREALHQRIGETVAWSFFAESMEFGGYEQGKLTLMLATDIAVDFAKRQHGEMIQGLAKVFYPDMVELCFVAKLADPAVAPPLTLTPRTSVPEIKLEPKFEPVPQTAAGVLDSTYPLDVECHFGNFVIGNANQEAYFAMRRAAEAPGLSSFNPLFLHGGPGLGKSHLLQAVAWHALDHGTARKVVARPADEFKNEFFASLSSRKNSVGFQAKLREADVLLIDDIQFLGATQAIQQELVSLINFMVSQRKQVILVSDRPPSEIPHLSKSLLEKCQSGLMLDVRSPAEELRQGILRKLADRRHAGSQVPEHVIAMLSQMGHGDVRELIGMLTRLIAFADIHREPLTEDLVRRSRS